MTRLDSRTQHTVKCIRTYAFCKTKTPWSSWKLQVIQEVGSILKLNTSRDQWLEQIIRRLQHILYSLQNNLQISTGRTLAYADSRLLHTSTHLAVLLFYGFPQSSTFKISHYRFYPSPSKPLSTFILPTDAILRGQDSSVSIAIRYGLDGPGSNPGGGEISRTRRPYRTCGPPSLLYNGYRFFPGGKAAGSWRWPPIPI
jgi:hypothetical protein